MRAWCERLWRESGARARLIALALGLLLGGLVYWHTGLLPDAAIAAIAVAFITLLLGAHIRRRQARLASLEETVAALREEVQRLRGGIPVYPQGGASPTASSAPAATASQVRADGVGPLIEPEGGSRLTSPSAWKRLWVWLVGDNAAVRVGVAVLFVGTAFLLNYAYDYAGAFSFGKRLAWVVVAAAGLLAIGWQLRLKRPAYGQALQGGGAGLLFAAVAGAGNAVDSLRGPAAFVLLVAVVALAGFLAVRQNARWIAILGIAGGFLAPVLASDMGENGVTLFGYYLVLNAGIFAIALHKSWRALNALGLTLTFSIAAVWGARFYQPEQFSAIEPFVILFFLLYLAIAVVGAARRAPQFDDYVDSIVVFGAPLLAFTLQLRVVRGFEHGAAWSAFAAGALYLILAAALHGRRPATLRTLAEAFFVLGLIFATLTLPLALDGRWTAGLWALEGVAVYWMGSRQGSPLARTTGLLLQLAAGAALLGAMYRGVSETPVLNGFFLGCVFIACAGLASSSIMARRTGHAGIGSRAFVMFLWGLGWWLLSGLHEIAGHAPREDVLNAALLFLTATCAAFSFLWGRGRSLARFPALALAPLMAVILLFQIGERADTHPLAALGILAWPVAFLFHFRILRRHEDVYPRDLSCAHILGMLTLVAACVWEASWLAPRVGGDQNDGPGVSLAAVLIVSLLVASAARTRWPVARYPGAYLWRGAKPLVALLALWSVYANTPGIGQADAARYVPLLNPLDIAHVAAFGVLVYWWRAVRLSGIDGPREFPSTWPVTAWCVAIFFWANAMLLRTLHYYADMPYQFQAMLDSNLVQMSISIFWTALALATMFVATWRRNRQMWIVGSVLMAAVILKLLVIEVPRAGVVESMISIIVVGVLMLVAGYLAPVPPAAGETA